MRPSQGSTKAASPCSRSFRSRRVRWSKAPYVAFDAGNVDFMFSETLVNALNEVDDAPWSEWRGINDAQAPRCLSQSALAQRLRPFGIRPRTILAAGAAPATRQFHAGAIGCQERPISAGSARRSRRALYGLPAASPLTGWTPRQPCAGDA